MTILLQDDFEQANFTVYNDNTVYPSNNWRCIYAGYGINGIHVLNVPYNGRTGKCMFFKPQINQSGTSACLVLSEQSFGNFDTTFYLRTNSQLRTTPNNWEMAWIMFRYQDNTHHYYFYIGADGRLEIGGKDYVKIGTTQIQTPDGTITTVGEGNQDQQFFLFTQGTPTITGFGLRKWMKIRLRVNGFNIYVYVNDVLIANIQDNGSTGSWLGSPKTFQSTLDEGKLGPYAEDAYGELDDIVVNSV